MPREKESYRDNLERICQALPDKGEMLSKSDVAKFTGLNHRTVAKIFSFKGNYISKAVLARELS